MKEMTDRELTDKISQVFDNFEDPSAEYGWQELRKKHPENNRKPLLFWWGAAAAVFLVVLGLWVVIPDVQTGDQQIVEGRSGGQILKGNKENSTRKASENIIINPKSPLLPATEKPADISRAKSLKYANLNNSNPSQYNSNPLLSKAISKASIPAPFSQRESAPVDIPNSVAVQVLSPKNNIPETPLLSLPDPDQSALTIKDHPEATRDSLIDVTAQMLALAQKNPVTDPHPHQVEELRYVSQKNSNPNHGFSFYAGSFFNYSLGSETKLNFGAGFTSDIKLSNNLKLSTGLALANNTLTYNNGVPSSGKEKLTFDALPSFGITGNNNLTTITKYDASLLVLDIPINIKYLLIPKDNKLYMLAGLSSGTYLSETYSLNYRNYSAAGSYVNQAQGTEVKNQLKGFDFARTLNISFGYSAILGKTQNFTIEPFLKYPLAGLGSENLKFGSTGVNLKLNFSHFKKR